MSPVVRLLALCAAFGVVSCLPIINPLEGFTKEREKLLEKYGYLGSGSGAARSVEELTEAVKNIQTVGGLKVTGQLNGETIKLLESDRCGMKDNYTLFRTSGSIDVGRALVARYYLQGTYWKKRDLTYKVISYTPDLPRGDQRRIFKTSFDMWQAASTLTITDVTDNDPEVPDDDVDILISFGSSYHKDAYPFDGQGGTLAHAFYPHNNQGLAGDAHFDDDESFTTGTSSGINLDWVALHEFGHSLGLEHSNVRESVMYPWYKGYKEDIQLTNDDVSGIQALYGRPPPPQPTTQQIPTTTQEPTTTQAPTATQEPTTTTQPPTTTQEPTTTKAPTTPPQVDPCKLRSYDTFFNGLDGKTYAVAGDDYWHIAHPYAGKESGPHSLVERFPGLQTPVDAAYTKGSYTFFFKGSRYWQYRYINKKFVVVYSARPIKELGLPSELNDMDAAFVYRNNRVYFLKGYQYWRYNEQLKRIDSGYPRTISRGWKGVTGTFDAVMTWKSNGKSYFFQGEEYLRIQQKLHSLDTGFPQNIALKWLRCDFGTMGRISGSLQIPTAP